MVDDKPLPEVEFVTVASRVVRNHDADRLSSMCSLLNTFKYAVQVQAGRNQWEAEDFRAFCISLCAMDEIGQAHHSIEHSIATLASKRAREG